MTVLGAVAVTWTTRAFCVDIRRSKPGSRWSTGAGGAVTATPCKGAPMVRVVR
jgi:hypothetical protein